jgi:hypothetical protein
LPGSGGCGHVTFLRRDDDLRTRLDRSASAVAATMARRDGDHRSALADCGLRIFDEAISDDGSSTR